MIDKEAINFLIGTSEKRKLQEIALNKGVGLSGLMRNIALTAIRKEATKTDGIL